MKFAELCKKISMDYGEFFISILFFFISVGFYFILKDERDKLKKNPDDPFKKVNIFKTKVCIIICFIAALCYLIKSF